MASIQRFYGSHGIILESYFVDIWIGEEEFCILISLLTQSQWGSKAAGQGGVGEDLVYPCLIISLFPQWEPGLVHT